MSEIIEQIGDSSFPVGLTIRMGIMGSTPVQLGTNVMAAIGEATHGPAMTVMPLTSEYETSLYYKSGPLARAGRVAFAQGLPAGYFVRVLGEGYKSAKKYVHDGITYVSEEEFFGDGKEGPYPLENKCYTDSDTNSVKIVKGETEKEFTIVYTPEELVGMKVGEGGYPDTYTVYLDQENGTLTFYTDEGPKSDEKVVCKLDHYGVLGVINSPNDGITGNSAYVDISDGTFPGLAKEAFKGDGSTGPYYLEFNDVIDDDDNEVTVDDVAYEIVFSVSDLATKKVLLDKAAGSLRFFEGEDPSENSIIEVKYSYKSKCLQISDGDSVQPVIDSLVDLVAIQAALTYNSVVNFTPEAFATHLPANGRYRLTGGTDGKAITSADYGRAHDVLMTYMEDTLTNVTTVVYCANEVQAGTYDLIPVLASKANEMKKNFYPAIHFIGLKPNEDPDRAGKIARNFANWEVSIVMNPWDVSQPDRLDATVARAAAEATAPLGTSCARRVANMALQGLSIYGLLNTYRRETIKALHNNRLDVLVKSEAGLFTFYGRTTAREVQYMECVDVRTMNYMIWVIKYFTDRIYFAKNTPSVRATFREDLANVLDRLVADEVMDAYTLDVKSGRSIGDKGLMLVKLEAENVGHIKQVRVDYYNGIIETANVE